MPDTYFKDPNALLDYTVDWSEWLGGDSITSSSWIVPAGLVLTDESHTTHTATAWISGGTPPSSYRVTNRIVTAGGRSDDRSLTFRLEDR